jgi:hypothetical protein
LQKAFIAAQERVDAEYVKNAVADDFNGIESNGDTTERAAFIRVGQGEKPANLQFCTILESSNWTKTALW